MAEREQFPAAPLSVRKARHYVNDRIVALGLGELRSSAELLTSELATNALVHARTGFTVAVMAIDSGLRIEVEDGAPPPLRRPSGGGGPDAVTGRGLHLVEAIATDWGIEETREGKLVWFELAATG